MKMLIFTFLLSFFLVFLPTTINAYTTCPLFASYSYLTDSCECYQGYINVGGSCISEDQYCKNKYGFNASSDYISGSCKCNSGYVMSNGSCISDDQYCKDQYGYNAKADYSGRCECRIGYIVSNNQCVYGTTYCSNNYGIHSNYDSISEECECSYGYVLNRSANKCISEDEFCQELFGVFSKADFNGDCKCKDGYLLKGTICVDADQICLDSFSDNSHYEVDTCKCDDGYIFTENSVCEDVSDYCYDLHGDGSYYIEDGVCGCESGYVLDEHSETCMEEEEFCEEYFAEGSVFSGAQECECESGYEIQDGQCVEVNIIRSLISEKSSSNDNSESNKSANIFVFMLLGGTGLGVYSLYKKNNK